MKKIVLFCTLFSLLQSYAIAQQNNKKEIYIQVRFWLKGNQKIRDFEVESPFKENSFGDSLTGISHLRRMRCEEENISWVLTTYSQNRWKLLPAQANDANAYGCVKYLFKKEINLSDEDEKKLFPGL